MKGLAAGALLLGVSPAPAVAQAPISGIFSNVQLSPETGDLGGLEIEFHPEAPRPYALVVFCEGWCNVAHRVPLKLDGHRFSLAFAEPLYDAGGHRVAENHYQVHGERVGDSLNVKLKLNTNEWQVRLPPQQARFGLDVAKAPKERRP